MTEGNPDYTEEEAAAILANEAVVVMTVGEWVHIVGAIESLTIAYPTVFPVLEELLPKLKEQVAADAEDLLG